MTLDHPDQKLHVGEEIELLTGYDEEKIEKRFGAPPIAAEGEGSLSGSRFLRALYFAHELHAGTVENDAYKAAMSLTVKGLNELFSDEPEDALPDEPDSPQGKGVSADA